LTINDDYSDLTLFSISRGLGMSSIF